VLWIVAPAYRGPVLIRGGQLDGANAVRFGDGRFPSASLRISAAQSGDGWRSLPSYTRLRARGCYAWRVDGRGFHEQIVFRARGELPPRPPMGDR
jgi:hypothetical protein